MILQAKNLRVEFRTRRGTLVAVDDVSFSVARGEVLGVVGESGAGKSLTGLAIMGLLEPPGRIAAGEVWLDGQRIDRLPHAALRALRGRRIGVVFQDPIGSLNPLYTIGEQLEETIRTHLGLAGKELRQRALALLSEVGIPAPQARLHHYPHQFSGGMRQRVVIALALAAEPILLIADEPTTALDVSMQAQIIALIKRVARERGTAVMLITHDMGVIAETADRVAVMYAGRIVDIGAVRDVLHAPSDGRIEFRGQRRQMIFQSPYASLNPRWRVRDIVAEPIRVLRLARKAEVGGRVAQLLAQVGLSADDGEKYPHEFSGGQRQRISIARALSGEPDLLICDEPTSALDVSVQAQILNLMADLQSRLA